MQYTVEPLCAPREFKIFAALGCVHAAPDVVLPAAAETRAIAQYEDVLGVGAPFDHRQRDRYAIAVAVVSRGEFRRAFAEPTRAHARCPGIAPGVLDPKRPAIRRCGEIIAQLLS